MATTNTRQARLNADKQRTDYFTNYRNLFYSLFDNSVVLENEDNLPKRYFLRVLREKGAIAYHKELKLYLPFVGSGIDIYGLPNRYQLISPNGFTTWAKPNEVVILRANDLQSPLAPYFKQQINKLVDLDLFINQNLDACRTMTIAEFPEKEMLLSLTNLTEARTIGATIGFVNKAQEIGKSISVMSTGAHYLVDKALEARKEVMNETLATIGISVANVDKKERVQKAEVMASQGYALDCLNTLINTVNYDAKYGGIPIRLKGNTNLYFQNEMEKIQSIGQTKEGE